MCIIVCKPSGVALPDKETLKRCFEKNSDGAGIAVAYEGKTNIIKGIFNFDKFYNLAKKIPVDAAALLHFRISTGGGVCPECCHPYPLTNNLKDLQATRIDFSGYGYAVAHNGIFSGIVGKPKNNDSMQFIATYLKPLQDLTGNIHSPLIEPILNRLVDTSRLAILSKNGTIKRYGNGWEEDGGCWYSNGGYKEYKWSSYTYGGRAYAYPCTTAYQTRIDEPKDTGLTPITGALPFKADKSDKVNKAAKTRLVDKYRNDKEMLKTIYEHHRSGLRWWEIEEMDTWGELY